ERRAFLFCREDRAILCRECDIPIHKANEHTQTHNRFLLTGVRISASSAAYTNPSVHSTSSSEQNSENRNSVNVHSYDHDMASNHSYNSSNMSKTTSSTTNYNQITEDGGSISTNNIIPEYLLESIPSWRFEDLLDSSYDPHCKTSDYWNHQTVINSNQQVEEESMGSFCSSTEEYSRMWEFHKQGPFVCTFPSSSHLL
ncbi:hypothetical protein KSS87_000154, partial [Heliosperma pusillum]